VRREKEEKKKEKMEECKGRSSYGSYAVIYIFTTGKEC
jgi:hypothetical protein